MNVNETLLFWYTEHEVQQRFYSAEWKLKIGENENWASGIHPDDVQAYQSRYLDHFNQQTAFTSLYRIRQKNNTYHCLAESANPVFDASGKFTGFTGFCIDVEEYVPETVNPEAYEHQLNLELTSKIQELNIINAALTASEERFKDLVQQAPVAIAMLSVPDLVINSANQLILKLWGKTTDVISKTLMDALPELKGQHFFQLLNDVYNSGIAYHGNEIAVALNHEGAQKLIYFDFTYHPVTNTQGDIDGIMIVALDATERVMNRQQIEDEDIRFKFMLNAIPQQVWTARPDGLLDFVNRVVCDEFGAPATEIIGEGWQKFVHPDDLGYTLQKWTTSLKNQVAYELEFRLLIHGTSYEHYLGRAQPFFENGKLKHWIGTNTNIENLEKLRR